MDRKFQVIEDSMNRMGITPKSLVIYFVKKGLINLSEVSASIVSPKKRRGSDFEKLRRIIAAKSLIDEEKIQEDSLLSEDLGLDSLDEAEILMQVEEEFGILIPDEEKVSTVGEILRFIDEKN